VSTRTIRADAGAPLAAAEPRVRPRTPDPDRQETTIMATAPRKTSPSAHKPATRKAPGASHPDAIALLRADHKHVSELFEQYESTRSSAKKKTLVAAICRELDIHAQIEEEIFYPAVKAALKDKELVPEAQVEHQSIKDLVAQVEDREPDGEMFDATIKVLSEYVKHHVKEEQNEIFVRAKKTRLDMQQLGEQLAARKQVLMDDPSQLERSLAKESTENFA